MATDPREIDALRVIGNALDHAPQVAELLTVVLNDAVEYRAGRPEGAAAGCRACEKGYGCDDHTDDAEALAESVRLARALGIRLDYAPATTNPVRDPESFARPF